MLIWIVIAAFAINISAILTIFYHVNKMNFRMENSGFKQKPHELFKNELNLSTEQNAQFKEMKKKSRDAAEPIVLKMKEQRKKLMNVLFEKNPDTVQINQISNEIQQSQALLLKYTIQHYLDLKKILKSEQQQKLNCLYQDLFGCPRMQMDKNCENSCGKGDGSGQGTADGNGGGKKHRHGHGWNNGF